MNKKAFTLAELLGVIMIIAILGGIAVYSVSHVIRSNQTKIIKSYEETMKSAAYNYLIDNSDQMPSVDSNKYIYLSQLLNSKHIDLFEGIAGSECPSVRSNSFVWVSRGPDLDNNFNLNYKICLICINENSEITYETIEGCTK